MWNFFKKLFNRTPEEIAFDTAKRNFTYVQDKENELKVYPTIEKPFSGDCEDFAFTLREAIGGDVWFVKVRQGNHAVLICDGWVYCNMRKRRIRKDNYPGEFVCKIYDFQFKRVKV